MFLYLTVALSLAVCHAQDITTAGATHGGHHTHQQHSHQPHSHPPHSHPTPIPTVAHTFDVANARFIKDLANSVMVLKTDSGCYVAHLNAEQVKAVADIEKLLHLESAIIHEVRQAQHFHLAVHPDHFSDEIKKRCDTLYGFKKHLQ